ncbi:hypothetical protein LZ32DRAFT_286357 [Colletotrichum eremochloae]|nr:hypothetical protein LZ32DRAFT_286357 [Colletotrichum eremochloae]
MSASMPMPQPRAVRPPAVDFPMTSASCRVSHGNKDPLPPPLRILRSRAPKKPSEATSISRNRFLRALHPLSPLFPPPPKTHKRSQGGAWPCQARVPGVCMCVCVCVSPILCQTWYTASPSKQAGLLACPLPARCVWNDIQWEEPSLSLTGTVPAKRTRVCPAAIKVTAHKLPPFCFDRYRPLTTRQTYPRFSPQKWEV